jgi:hypothetical protein
MATGTDGKATEAENDFAIYLANQGGKQCTAMDGSGKTNAAYDIASGVFERGRRDLNAQPSDRQSDALTN